MPLEIMGALIIAILILVVGLIITYVAMMK